MEIEFVPYQQAIELKELGFDEPCFGYYNNGNEFTFFVDVRSGNTNSEFRFFPTAPTFSQAFRWFREKGSDVKVQKESTGLYFGFYWTGAAWITVGAGSYEEAELACLRKLIEIVKNERA